MSIENNDFYSSMSRECGALQIACLNADSLDADFLHRCMQAWLNSPNAGLLPWLDQRSGVLSRPFSCRPWAKSLLLLSFLPVPDPGNPLFQLPEALPGRPSARLAAYVLHEDYHRTGHRILDKIIRSLALSAGEFEAGVDAGPLLEKSLGVAAGLGRFGFNTLLRTAEWGTQVHLGYLFTTRPLPVSVKINQPEFRTSCADCRLCLQNCPNQALSPTAGLQLRLCRSFLSSEKKGPLTWREQHLLGGTLAGCSLCSRCCPDATPLPGVDRDVDAEALCLLPTAKLERLIQGTVLQHIGAARLKRNAVAALGIQLPPSQRRELQQKLLLHNNSPSVRQTLANWPL